MVCLLKKFDDRAMELVVCELDDVAATSAVWRLVYGRRRNAVPILGVGVWWFGCWGLR